MNGYRPLDISRWCNAGPEGVDEGEAATSAQTHRGVLSDVLDKREPTTGAKTLQGLPFQIGGQDGDSCFIVLDGSAGRVTVPVNAEARRVVFAHTLLETDAPAGGPLGVQVAEYIFRLSGGAEVRVPIRERFEIAPHLLNRPRTGTAKESFAKGAPFLAVKDTKHILLPRHEGRWEDTGRRQMESMPVAIRDYYLWSWANPEPGAAIESIEVVPSGPRFMIAAITLGQLDEHPFVRQGRRPVRMVLKSEDDARKPFDLDVEVDRGDTTYAFPLPSESPKEFLDDDFKGWGEAQNTNSSPAYVEIAATPSATVTVKQSGDTVATVNWGELEDKREVETARMRFELVEPGKNWVNVTVVDDETGDPVPCRVHFRSPEGVPYQPYGHHNQVNSNLDSWHIDVGGDLRLGHITYAYIDGTCQGWLPRGDVIVDVARGFEYEPIRTKVRIEPGQRKLTLRLKRWIDMNERGWFSGDSHVHFLSTQGSHLESQGEDLNVVNLLQSQWGSLFTNTEDFTGEPSVWRTGNNIVYVGHENRQHVMGHMNLWGLKRPVMPWCSDGPDTAEIGGTMETTLSHWADEAHAQGGYAIGAHFPMPNGEQAALVAAGRLDGVEMLRMDESYHLAYYRYLNCGYRLPLVGGTDKMSSDVPIGLYRTYVSIPDYQGFTYENWCRNVARGRTFLSSGPILHFKVEGKEVGDTVHLSGAGTVEVEARAESILPIYRLEIVQAGRVVASTEESKGARRLELRTSLNVESHTWLAARCGGPGYFEVVPHYDDLNRGVMAHTSPIYVACGGDWSMFDEAQARYMLTMIEGNLGYIGENAPMHRPGTVTHHHGEEDHLAYLQRPFLEAREAVHRRFEEMGLTH